MDDTLRLKDNKIRELEDSVARMGYENEKAREQVCGTFHFKTSV